LKKEFRALSIADVLELTVEDATRFFEKRHSIVKMLRPLQAVGLSYIRLGQPLPTLSGGEAAGKRLWPDPRRLRANKFLTRLHLVHGSRTD